HHFSSSVTGSGRDNTCGISTVVFGLWLSQGATLEVLHVGLLRANRLGGLGERRALVVGEIRPDDPAYARGADFGLDAQVDAADAVLAIDPGADRQHRTG